MSTRIAVVIGCVAALATSELQPPYAGSAAAAQHTHPLELITQARKDGTEIATLSKLPSLGGNSEALAVNEEGIVIAGLAWDRSDMLHAVKWTLQNGTWAISTLPYPGSAVAWGVNNQGDVVGYAASSPRHAILWPSAGGYHIELGCDSTAVSDETVAYGISARGQVVVGRGSDGAAVWQPPLYCRENLPLLEEGGTSSAYAINGDGTIVGGFAARNSEAGGVPARWNYVEGQWQIEPLDSRRGRAAGANADGDLAGSVSIPCALDGGCVRAVIWYVAGGLRELGTLGGEESWARDINAAGEVVGLSTSPRVGNTAYFWSASLGMFQLPVKTRWAAANAVSDVRPDSTRLVVGMDAQANAVVWVVRNP